MDEISKLVLERLNPESNDKIHAIYKYGSQVYGSLHEHSDYDFIVVSDVDVSNTVSMPNVDINSVTPDEFQKNLNNQEIWALECVFTSPIFSRKNFELTIDIKKLRSSISRNSDQSFNKAKKKFISPYDLEGELMRGKKSLFHAFRVVLFGIQIVKHQRIVDFQEANCYFTEIMTNSSDKWEDYSYLKQKHNALMTAFRAVAPK